mgnify:CR=1 FL=1
MFCVNYGAKNSLSSNLRRRKGEQQDDEQKDEDQIYNFFK